MNFHIWNLEALLKLFLGIKHQQEFFSVAPMMDYTDRHQRTLMRLISRKTTLYTEMITTNALVRSGNIDVILFTNTTVL